MSSAHFWQYTALSYLLLLVQWSCSLSTTTGRARANTRAPSMFYFLNIWKNAFSWVSRAILLSSQFLQLNPPLVHTPTCTLVQDLLFVALGCRVPPVVFWLGCLEESCSVLTILQLFLLQCFGWGAFQYCALQWSNVQTILQPEGVGYCCVLLLSVIFPQQTGLPCTKEGKVQTLAMFLQFLQWRQTLVGQAPVSSWVISIALCLDYNVKLNCSIS